MTTELQSEIHVKRKYTVPEFMSVVQHVQDYSHKQTRKAAHTGQNVLASATRGSEITGRTVTFFTWLAPSQDEFQPTSKNEQCQSTLSRVC